jgi:CRP/FNR family transcriptional regulator, cyclic AMP receptor protein
MAATDTSTGPLGARSASAVLADAGPGAPAATRAAQIKGLEEQLQEAGLIPLGTCAHLSDYGPDLLRTSPLLQDLSPAEACILGASMLFIRAAPGQLLIREGEAGDWMMLLLKGTVDVTRLVEPRPAASPDTAEEVTNEPEIRPAISRVAVLRPGAAFGEMSMLDSEPRYASCTAIEAVEAGVLGRHAIALLIRDHPAVGAKLLVKITQLMAQRLRNTSNRLVKLLRKR